MLSNIPFPTTQITTNRNTLKHENAIFLTQLQQQQHQYEIRNDRSETKYSWQWSFFNKTQTKILFSLRVKSHVVNNFIDTNDTHF